MKLLSEQSFTNPRMYSFTKSSEHKLIDLIYFKRFSNNYKSIELQNILYSLNKYFYKI